MTAQKTSSLWCPCGRKIHTHPNGDPKRRAHKEGAHHKAWEAKQRMTQSTAERIAR